MGAPVECVIFDFGAVLSLPRDDARARVMAGLCGLEIGRWAHELRSSGIAISILSNMPRLKR